MKNKLKRGKRNQKYAVDVAPLDNIDTPTPRTALSQKKELTDLRQKVLELELQLQKSPTKPKFFSGIDRNLQPIDFIQHRSALVNEENDDDDNDSSPLRGISTAPLNRGKRKMLFENASKPPPTSSDTDKQVGIATVETSVSTETLTSPPVESTSQMSESLDLSSESSLISTKLIVDTNSQMTAAVSHRHHMYNIIRKLNERNVITEDQVAILKKFVDAEISDVIKTLLSVNESTAIDDIKHQLKSLFELGSPSKLQAKLNPAPPPPSLFQRNNVPYPLQKIAHGLAQLGPKKPGHEVVVLVSSGAYNPIHMLHIRAFYLAKQYIEANSKYAVVGGIISPTHDTFVRTKTRRTPRHLIPSRHRLAMLEAATSTSSWLEVDKWEITRRRVLDYLSTLSHVRESCEAQFPSYKFRAIYVCGCNTIVKLNHNILRTEGFGCVVICRPNQLEMLLKHLGSKWSKVAYVVEDLGVLSCELNQATSFQVRKVLVYGGSVKGMVGMHVANYMKKHEIGDKIAGRLKWTSDDRSWREEDLPFVEYL